MGLATFPAEQRIKEIGIRKVLRASVRSAFALLFQEFLILVAIALFIASPIAWHAQNQRRIGSLIARHYTGGYCCLGRANQIAPATVSFQAIKAALVNLIKSFRSE